MPSGSRVGVVVIGRNEGERLVRSLQSVVASGRPIVYVDSGSSDDSCANARRLGVEVVDLDMSVPFSAARARNAGYRQLIATDPDLSYVQFLDGDMEVLPGWIDAAASEMDRDLAIVAVTGWRHEREVEASIYNRMCDVEWRLGQVGEVTNFGGDVMIRVDALVAVDGYDERVIAGEDDELGVRLRQAGGRIVHIDHDCTTHDAAMHSAGAWWKRAKRCGHAYAQVSAIHGAPPERKWVRQVRRSVLWGAVVPAAAVVLSVPTLGMSLGLFGRYPYVAARVAADTRRRGFSWLHSATWGVSCALSQFPEAVGVAQFHLDRLRGRAPKIIEHKAPASTSRRNERKPPGDR
jgi:GT2 family glycosyltransferase